MLVSPFTPDDYPAVADILNGVFRDYPSTPDELRFQDTHREPMYRFQRLVARLRGHVVGTGEYVQYPWVYHPRKFIVQVAVASAHRGQGVGAALYQHLIAALEPFDPLALGTQTRADWSRSLRFIGDRGFTEQMRNRESRLDLASFDPRPFAGAAERVQAAGLEIHSFAELTADPDRDRKLFELGEEIEDDVPSADPITRRSFEGWLRARRHAPDFLPEANFIALRGDEWVGLSSLRLRRASPDLEVGLTGVKRSARRLGIALALKLRTIDFARRQGAAGIITGNEVNNAGMIELNERLGFVLTGTWIVFSKQLGEAAE